MSGGSPSALFADSREQGGWRRVDARFRLVAALGFAFLMPVLHAPAALGCALVLSIAAMGVARTPLRAVLARLAIVEGFLLVLLLTMPFAIPGTPLFAVAGVSASVEGFVRVLEIVARINACVLMLMALLGGLGGQGLAGAITGVGLPPVLGTLLQMTMRYVATIGEEYRRLRLAMKVRGFRLGSTFHSWRSLGNLVGMLLVRSLDRAERVHRAMLCRGYSGRFPAMAEAQAIGAGDWAFAGLALTVFAGLGLLELFA